MKSEMHVHGGDYENLAATTKSIMRLCAFAMVSNDYLDPSEANVIANIILSHYAGRSLEDLKVLLNKVKVEEFVPKSAALSAEFGVNPVLERIASDDETLQQKFECANEIVSHIGEQLKNSATRKSIFMNLDSLDEERLKRTVVDLQLVARADHALLDSEREAFRVFCKCARIVHSSRLWQKLQNYTDEELWGDCDVNLKIIQKNELDVNDYKSVKKSIEFYDIKGPIVDGACYLMQRELTRHHDMIYHTDKGISTCAFVVFCATALITYLKISHHSLFEFLNSLDAIAKDWINSETSPSYMLTGFAVIAVSIFVIRKVLKKIRRKRNLRSFTMTTVVSWSVTIILLIISLISNQMCILIMMLAIEWLMFMKEQLIVHKSSTTPSMKVMVAAAIIADMSLGIIEHYAHHDTSLPNFIYIIASSMFLGCICFFFGKWLENRREQTHVDQEDMNKCVSEIMDSISN